MHLCETNATVFQGIFFLSHQFCWTLTLHLPQPLHCILGIPSLPSQPGSLPRSIPHDGLEPLSRSDEPRGSRVAAEQARAVWPASPGQRAGRALGTELHGAEPRQGRRCVMHSPGESKYCVTSGTALLSECFAPQEMIGFSQTESGQRRGIKASKHQLSSGCDRKMPQCHRPGATAWCSRKCLWMILALAHSLFGHV